MTTKDQDEHQNVSPSLPPTGVPVNFRSENREFVYPPTDLPLPPVNPQD